MRVANHMRQWVALPGGSCDLRVGTGLLDDAGPILRGTVGRPRSAALVYRAGEDADVVERLRRQLVDAGFRAYAVALSATARTLGAASALAGELLETGVTSDDLIVALGNGELLSLAAFVAGAWYGGAPLVVVPLALEAAVAAVVTPQGFDVGASEDLLAVRPCAKQALCDLQVMASGDMALVARAEMAATAMCDSERAFAALWDRAGALADGEVAALCDQLCETVKGRGQLAASTSPSIRASSAYGASFARALSRLVPDLDAGIALGEGLRFCSRLAAGMGICPVDDVLSQDELLERLGVGFAACRLDGALLAEEIKRDRFRRTNRLMLELPRMVGRVRLSVVDEALLREHAEAWCAARTPR